MSLIKKMIMFLNHSSDANLSKGIITNIQAKLEGKVPVTRKELFVLVNSWGRKKSFSIPEGYDIPAYPQGKCYNLSNLDISGITDLSYIFAHSLFGIKIKKFESNDCNIYDGIVDKALSKLEKKQEINDISKWDVSNVTDMSYLFQNFSFFGDISNWNTSKVENMTGIFYETNYFSSDINTWNVSSVTNMTYAFYNGISKNISDWDVSSVIYMISMFYNSVPKDISKWNTSKVESMRSMFDKADFNGDISSWNVSSVKDMGFMFALSKFNGDISKWDVSKVENMDSMFMYSEFNQNLNHWKLNANINFEEMINGAEKLEKKYYNKIKG